MTSFTEQSHLEEALRRLEGTKDPRLKQVLSAFTKHMFAFINEVKPTEDEWMAGIQFLTETGKMCDGARQEFILFSDTFGISMLVDHHNHHAQKGATESSVLGPFYRPGAPEYANGESICQDGAGEPAVIAGQVTDAEGTPIAGAKLDVWQTAASGIYQVQDASQPDFNLCGVYTTDGDGRFEVKTVKPVSYPVPDDGPVGRLLNATGRHAFRPAHIHFIVSADGYEPVVTQLFTDDDDYLQSDVVFGVKDSLVVHYDPDGNGCRVSYDFGLQPAA
ncbi:MAG: 6-chlorohydroxyquinol-1,2-dioxygenase [Rhodospirillales bacterium]|nr:6-chlorohydroxyquinol-1,2-dioxygenase [Rhodospirillales bacterium]